MSDQNSDRIRLAEAMGWRYEARDLFGCAQDGEGVVGQIHIWRNGVNELKSRYGKADPLPDPFTDANDDYAVLEWMRKASDEWRDKKFYQAFGAIAVSQYRYYIGDYARAALKMIDNE